MMEDRFHKGGHVFQVKVERDDGEGDGGLEEVGGKCLSGPHGEVICMKVKKEEHPNEDGMDGSNSRSQPERRAGSLDYRGFTEQHHSLPHHHQPDRFYAGKAEPMDGEEPCMMDEEPCKKEEEGTPPEISPGGQQKGDDVSDDPAFSPDGAIEAEDPITPTLGTRKRPKPAMCSECGRWFTRKTLLVLHIRVHTGEKPYACSECGKRFTQKIHLIKHQRTHTGEKPYSCSECGRCFSSESHILRHRATHTMTEERPYSCSDCGKRFMAKSSLLSHQKAHTGEKPFPCSECRKRFASKSTLNKHQMLHTEVKPFACSECGKQYIQKVHRDKHERKHAAERPFSSP